ncbi:MAG: amidohydrolase [bacterium]|nr:amidohydrolase [bacterium]
MFQRRCAPTARGTLVGLTLWTLACSGSPAPEPADLILTHGRVYTLSWSDPTADGTPAADAPFRDGAWHPDAEAVVMRGDRIVMVGGTADALAYRGERTEVIDLGGATVLPGLVDSHTHVVELGEKLTRVDLTAAEDERAAVELVAARAAEVEAGRWIVGWGWDEGAWAGRYPDMRLLSERVPDHPVVMRSLHGFAVWGNRPALERAGITRDTVAPSGGEILRDERGEPTGVFLNRATPLLTAAMPAPSPEELRERLLAGLVEMARSGYVAVHDAGVGTELMAACEALDAAGRLPIRLYAMINARDEALMRAWLERGPERAGGKLVRRSVKAYYDGALGSRGARLLEDYSDRPGHRGVSGGEYGFDQELVAAMMRAGFQVGIHAIGDAGNRETLDFLARGIAGDEAIRAGRHRVEHAQVVHPDDFVRFGELGLVAAVQSPHAVEDKAWAEERLGAERIRGAYAWRTLRRSGAHLVFGSDLAGSDHDVFYGLHAAVTRRGKDLQPPEGWYPEEAMTPEEAVRGYTVWAAYAAFWEDETGILAPGRWADVTVLSVDPLDAGMRDPAALLEGSVLLTVVGGEIVHRGDL